MSIEVVGGFKRETIVSESFSTGMFRAHCFIYPEGSDECLPGMSSRGAFHMTASEAEFEGKDLCRRAVEAQEAIDQLMDR